MYQRLHPWDIVAEVKEARFFSILADEAADSAKFEQIPLVLRYVNSGGIPCDDFIVFLRVERITGAAIAESILQFLEDIGLLAAGIRGQGYDGASNKAGKHQGCAAIIRNQSPKARYVYCAAHVLNLCVVAACNVDEVSKMWATMKELFFFFDNSPKEAVTCVPQ